MTLHKKTLSRRLSFEKGKYLKTLLNKRVLKKINSSTNDPKFYKDFWRT